MCLARLPVITRRRLSALSAALLFCMANVGHAQTVDLDQLWLPQSYLRHLPRLYDAAQLVDASSRCAEFITGTVAVDRSRLEQPVFTFTCRDQNRQTYALLVDGLTLNKLDGTRPEGFITFEDLELEYQREQALAEERQRHQDELARQRAQRQKEREEQRRAERLWPICWAQLQERVGNMAELEWLTETMSTPGYALESNIDEQEQEQEEGQEQEIEMLPAMIFVTDFNAKDINGEALRYRAQCTVKDAQEYQLDIKARRTEQESEKDEPAD